MIIHKSGQLSKNEKEIIQNILQDFTDAFGDTYITRNNLRLYIKENIDVVFEGLSKGDKLSYEENRGFILIDGYSDKAPRKYIKIVTLNDNATNRLLKTLHWHVREDLYVKISKNNPVKRVLERNGFRFAGDRGKQILLCRKYIPSKPKKQKEEVNEKV